MQVVNNFIPQRYLGTWYEVARLPMFAERNCYIPITATYSADPNDAKKIFVRNACYKKNGNLNTANGVAKFTENNNMAKLKVSFLPSFLQWLPFAKGNYWVLYTDYEHYSLVGEPQKEYLWILSRSEKFDSKKIQELIKIADQEGFDTKKLIFNYPL